MTPSDHAELSRNRGDWPTATVIARQRQAIEEALRLLEDSPCPRAILARWRLAEA